MDAPLIDEVTAEDLLKAYRVGIFPMAENADDTDIFWIDPEMRGVIPLDQFHVPASLRKSLRKNPYRVSINTAFDRVIDACAAQTPGRPETWINPMIAGWYKELHRMGHAHSVECWDADGTLAGGLYGLAIERAFFGESMFSRMTDASKIALVHLVARLRQKNFELLDCQFVNEHLKQFGCVAIPRDDYHGLLGAALSPSGLTSAFVSSSDAGASAGAGSSVVAVASDFLPSGSLQSSTVTS